MKKESWLLSMNNIDDKYIEEAKPSKAVSLRRKKKLIILAACMAVMFALSLVLFIPYSAEAPKMIQYSGSNYYEVIEKLNQYYYVPPKYKNNFEALVGGLSNIFLAGMKNAGAEDDGLNFAVDNMAPMPEGMVADSATNTSTNKGESYEEVTDNQVKGVIEADLFKRSDKYIYYYDDGNLMIYSIEGPDSKCVGIFSVYNEENTDNIYYSNNDSAEMYLSEDCSTITLVNANYGNNNEFSVYSLDVTEPSNVFVKNIVSYKGDYVSSRMVEGKLYLVSSFYAKNDYNKKKNFVPSYTTANDEVCYIPVEDIYYPEELSNPSYTVLTKLDEKTLNVDDDYALLSFYNPVIYTSKNSFYFTRVYNEKKTEEDKYTVNSVMTEICRIDYSGDGFKNIGSVVIEGEVNDQYSMDEYDGILRVFTSTDRYRIWHTDLGHYGFSDDDTGRNASLFCVDINSLKVVSKVERFAPKGENVKSARFDGDTAYVCTAVQLEDPVYFFDLSNLDKITYKETGTVEGFSTSLVDFGEGYLLGIGQKNWGTPKIEIYKEEGDKVVSVAAIEMPDSYISTDYKAYYIDRENGYIGLGVSSYGYGYGQTMRYVIFKFENEKLDVAYECVMQGDNSRMRGTYIDEYIYVLWPQHLKVIPESELK